MAGLRLTGAVGAGRFLPQILGALLGVLKVKMHVWSWGTGCRCGILGSGADAPMVRRGGAGAHRAGGALVVGILA